MSALIMTRKELLFIACILCTFRPSTTQYVIKQGLVGSTLDVECIGSHSCSPSPTWLYKDNDDALYPSPLNLSKRGWTLKDNNGSSPCYIHKPVAETSDAGHYHCLVSGVKEIPKLLLIIVENVQECRVISTQAKTKNDNKNVLNRHVSNKSLTIVEGEVLHTECTVKMTTPSTLISINSSVTWSSANSQSRASFFSTTFQPVSKVNQTFLVFIRSGVTLSGAGASSIQKFNIDVRLEINNTSFLLHSFLSPDVNVLYKVKQVKIISLQSNYEVVQFGDTLRCQADGNPAPSYRWFQSVDNRSISVQDTIHVQIYGGVKIQCLASNIVNGEEFEVQSLPVSVVIDLEKATSASQMSRQDPLTWFIIAIVTMVLLVTSMIAHIIQHTVYRCKRAINDHGNETFAPLGINSVSTENDLNQNSTKTFSFKLPITDKLSKPSSVSSDKSTEGKVLYEELPDQDSETQLKVLATDAINHYERMTSSNLQKSGQKDSMTDQYTALATLSTQATDGSSDGTAQYTGLKKSVNKPVVKGKPNHKNEVYETLKIPAQKIPAQ